MPEQELDLLKIPTGFTTKLCTRPTEIMRPEVLDPNLFRGLLDDRPDGPVAQGFTVNLVRFVDLPE